MTKTIMIVGLKIPDTTAKSALQAFKDQKIHEINDLQRWIYYEFEHSGSSKEFGRRAARIDILVNANKNTVKILESKANLKEMLSPRAAVIVEDIDDKSASLTSTLRDRLGLQELNGLRKGVLWAITASGDSKRISEYAVKNLLYNIHYQTYEVIV